VIKLIISEFRRNTFFYTTFLLAVLVFSYLVSCEIVQFLGILLFMRIQLLCIKNSYLDNTFFMNFYLPVKKNTVVLSKILAGYMMVLLCFFIPKIMDTFQFTQIIYEMNSPIRNCFSIMALFLGFIYYFFFCHFTLRENLQKIYSFNKLMAFIMIPVVICFIKFDHIFLPVEALFQPLTYWFSVLGIIIFFLILAFCYSYKSRHLDI